MRQILKHFSNRQIYNYDIVKNHDYLNVRYQIKPFMLWIWISVLLITLGGVTSLLKRKNEN